MPSTKEPSLKELINSEKWLIKPDTIKVVTEINTYIENVKRYSPLETLMLDSWIEHNSFSEQLLPLEHISTENALSDVMAHSPSAAVSSNVPEVSSISLANLVASEKLICSKELVEYMCKLHDDAFAPIDLQQLNTEDMEYPQFDDSPFDPTQYLCPKTLAEYQVVCHDDPKANEEIEERYFKANRDSRMHIEDRNQIDMSESILRKNVFLPNSDDYRAILPSVDRVAHVSAPDMHILKGANHQAEATNELPLNDPETAPSKTAPLYFSSEHATGMKRGPQPCNKVNSVVSPLSRLKSRLHISPLFSIGNTDTNKKEQKKELPHFAQERPNTDYEGCHSDVPNKRALGAPKEPVSFNQKAISLEDSVIYIPSPSNSFDEEKTGAGMLQDRLPSLSPNLVKFRQLPSRASTPGFSVPLSALCEEGCKDVSAYHLNNRKRVTSSNQAGLPLVASQPKAFLVADRVNEFLRARGKTAQGSK